MKLSKEDYLKKKEDLQRIRCKFSEVETSQKTYLKVGGLRYYLDNPSFDLTKKELGLILQVSNFVRKAAKKKAPLQNVEGLANYCMYNCSKSFYVDSLFEIDIKSAYLTAALNRNLISVELYQKFSEIETDSKEIERKKNLAIDHQARYIDKDSGNMLVYSKDCRLISLGCLATRKKTTTYSSEPIITATTSTYTKREGGITHIKQQKNVVARERSEAVSTKEHYNAQEANIFYTLALDIDNIMLEALNIEGAFLCWTDAIFCTGDVVEKIQILLEKSGFFTRTIKRDFLDWNAETKRFLVEDKIYRLHQKKHIEHVYKVKNLTIEVKTALSDYLEIKEKFLNLSESKQLSILESSGISALEIKKETEEKGFSNFLDCITWHSLKKILNITHTKDVSLFFLAEMLEKYGINYADFVKIRTGAYGHEKRTYENGLIFDMDLIFLVDRLEINKFKSKKYKSDAVGRYKEERDTFPCEIF